MKQISTILLLMLFTFQGFAQDKCNVLVDSISITILGDCDTVTAYCTNIAYGDFLNGDYTIQDNNLTYSGNTAACNHTQVFTFEFNNNIPDNGTIGPYMLDSLFINGSLFSGQFLSLAALTDSMNIWDPSGNWVFNDFGLTIKGGNPSSTYSNMFITQIATTEIGVAPVTSEMIAFGTKLFLSAGTHLIHTTYSPFQCSDTLEIIVECDTTTYLELVSVPADVTVSCSMVPTPFPVTTEGNCPDTMVTINLTEVNQNELCPGTYELVRTWTASDNCGNTIMGTQIVTVEDINPPVIEAAPVDTTIDLTIGDTVPAAASLTATDNCNASAFVEFAEDTTIITNGYQLLRTWTSTDLCGNIAANTQLVDVLETTPFEVTIYGDSIICAGNEGSLYAFAPNAVSFNWSTGDTMDVITIIPSQYELYAVTVTDNVGNTATAEFEVSVDNPVDIEISETLCDGETYEYANVVYTATTLDTIVITPSNGGCDSTIILDLQFFPTSQEFQTVTVCNQNDVRIDTLSFQTIYGCDSIVIIDYIFEYSADSTFIEAYTCELDSVGLANVYLTNSAGCDSVVITNTIFVGQTNPIIIDLTTCQKNQEGSTTDTLTSINGCDSIVITNVVFDFDPPTTTIQLTTCIQNEVGTTTETLVGSGGCDSLVVTNTQYDYNPDTTFVDGTTCFTQDAGLVYTYLTNAAGCDSIIATNNTYVGITQPTIIELGTCLLSEVGTTTDTLISMHGCDSIVITNIIYDFDPTTTTIQLTTCNQNEVGTTTDTLVNMMGCDSLVITNTEFVYNPDSTFIEIFTCEIDSVGIESIYLTNAEGCDSVVTTSTIFIGQTNPTIIELGTCLLSEVGTTTDTLISMHGCDSIVITNIIYDFDPTTTTIQLTTCIQNEVGTSIDTLLNMMGCDSLVITNTEFVYNPDSTFVEAFTCETQDAGLSYVYLTNAAGCDSIIVTNNIYVGLTNPTTIDLGTCLLSEVGTTTDTLISMHGCDSIVITNVIYDFDPPTTTIQLTTCIQNEVGTSIDTLVNMMGCDSLVITNTEYVYSPDTTFLDAVTCIPAEAGVENIYLTNMEGCDSIVTIITSFIGQVEPTYITQTTCRLSEVESSIDTLTNPLTGCDSIVITETIYDFDPAETTIELSTCNQNEAGTTIDTLVNMIGCDSLVITITSYFPGSDSTLIELVTCDPAEAGIENTVLSTTEGCDSLVTTVTTFIGQTEPTLIETFTCNQNEVNTTIDTLTNVNGCDSIVITSVQYTPTTDTLTIEIFTCNPDSVGYTQEVFTTAEGCDSIVGTQVIFVGQVSPTVITIGTCDESQVGTETEVFTNMNGCDSTVIIETFYDFDPNPTIIDLTTCDQNAVGTVTDTLSNQSGCDSLVITTTTFSIDIDTVLIEILTCDTSEVNRTTEVFTNQQGCDSLVITDIIFSDNGITTTLQSLTCIQDSVGTFTNVYESYMGCDSTVIEVIGLDTNCEGDIVFSGIPDSITIECNDSIPTVPNVFATSVNCPGDIQINYTEIITNEDECGYDIIRTWIAVDLCGKTSEAKNTIHVRDTEKPVFSTTLSDLTIECGDTATLPQVLATDNCDTDVIIEMEVEEMEGGCNYIRTWTAYDKCGNSASISQTVIVLDSISPILGEVPVDTTIYAVFGEEIPTPEVTATDDCDTDVKVVLNETESVITNGYTLTRTWLAVDKCGNESEPKTQVITVIGGPIWPGDTDSSYVVDIMDIFNIGFGFGKTGTDRNNPTIEWISQYTPLWAENSRFNDVNFRHADTNGDGIIDEHDVDAIVQNWGLSHKLVEEDSFEIRNDFPIDLETVNVSEDGWAEVNIMVGDDNFIIQDFYGVSFRFFYDWTKVESGTMTITYEESWAGDLDENLIKLEKENYSEGEFNAAIVRTNQVGVNGSGRIGTLRFKVKPNAGNELRMKVEQTTEISSGGSIANGETGIVEIDLTTTGTAEAAILDRHLRMYPNPASSEIHLSLDQGFQPEWLTIYDVTGQIIQHKEMTDRETNLDVSSLAPGVYFIQVQSNEGLLKKKLTIAR